MKSILRTLTVVALVGLTTVWVWAAQGRSLKVTVNYTGSGEVSAAAAAATRMTTASSGLLSALVA